jgi:hypothetical protein
MALKSGDRSNFETLQRAAGNGDLALIETTDKATGKYVAVVAAVWRNEVGEYEIVPIARLFAGNPYDELNPPV